MGNEMRPRIFLDGLMKAALAAADPLKVTPPCLPKPPKGRTVVIGAGKASAAMAQAVEQNWDGELSGLVVTRYGYEVKTDRIAIIKAAHPVPDEAGQQAAEDILKAVQGLTEDDLVLCLISGGGSALLSKPAPCLSAEEKQQLNKDLLRSGATIHEMNTLRKHLSSIKGGQLALAAHPARVVTLIISDVPGDDPSVVASGPTLPDHSTQEQARAVLDKYKITVSDAVKAWLENPDNETAKPGDPRFDGHEVHIISKASDALEAAAAYAKENGITPVLLGDDLEGEARSVGAEQAQQAAEMVKDAPCVLLSGGETTVTVKGKGRGGRNTEYLLAAMMECAGNENISGLAIDTDGIDGSEENAGAFFMPDTLKKAKSLTLDAEVFLENNDAYSLFEAVESLVITGPTFTNVNDFRALLVSES